MQGRGALSEVNGLVDGPGLTVRWLQTVGRKRTKNRTAISRGSAARVSSKNFFSEARLAICGKVCVKLSCLACGTGAGADVDAAGSGGTTVRVASWISVAEDGGGVGGPVDMMAGCKSSAE
jgi:hypothetical protein